MEPELCAGGQACSWAWRLADSATVSLSQRLRSLLSIEEDMTMSLAYKMIESPVGKLKLVASEKGLVAVLWENDRPNRVRLGEMVEDKQNPVLVRTERQLTEYFAGERREFSVPLEMRGTRFQQDVWDALLAIPFGETRSYSQLAKQLGNPQATRAVGAARTEEILCRSLCLAIASSDRRVS